MRNAVVFKLFFTIIYQPFVLQQGSETVSQYIIIH